MAVFKDFEKRTGYVNLRGDVVTRNPQTHPYSYDPFLLWKGDYKEGDSIVYSDRLISWDHEKFNKCCMEVFNNKGQNFNNRKPKDIEKFLSLYFDKDIKLTAIEEGCNVSNGYPYWIFYFVNVCENNNLIDLYDEMLLDSNISELNLSARSFNALYRSGITTVRQLINMYMFERDRLLCIRNLGKASYAEIVNKLENVYSVYLERERIIQQNLNYFCSSVEFLRKYLGNDKLQRILDGVHEELSADYIKLYTQPFFNLDQMIEIKLAIEEEIPIDLIHLVAHHEYSNAFMEMIFELYKHDVGESYLRRLLEFGPSELTESIKEFFNVDLVDTDSFSFYELYSRIIEMKNKDYPYDFWWFSCRRNIMAIYACDPNKSYDDNCELINSIFNPNIDDDEAKLIINNIMKPEPKDDDNEEYDFIDYDDIEEYDFIDYDDYIDETIKKHGHDPITELNLSTRTYNTLIRYSQIRTIYDLTKSVDNHNITKIYGVGVKILGEIITSLNSFLGINIYKLDDILN